MRPDRLTADGLVRLLPKRDEYREQYRKNADRLHGLQSSQEQLRRLLNQLNDVTEVFEGVPLEVFEATYSSVRNLGEGVEIRFASVSATGEDPEEGPCGPWLLRLGGRGLYDFSWGTYADKGDALLAAKKFCAKGVVPPLALPDPTAVG